MYKSNLIKLLSKLTESEFKNFGKFVNSPYFNSNKKVTELYKLLVKFYPGFDSLELSKENIFRILYGKDNIVYGTMYYLISETESLLEKFISIEKINPLMLDITYLKELNQYELQNQFNVKSKKLLRKLNKKEDPLNIYHLLASEVIRDNLIHKKELLTKKDLSAKEWKEPSFQLIKLFLKNSLRNILLYQNYNRVRGVKLEIPMLNETLDYLKSSRQFIKDFEINIIYLQIDLLLNGNEKSYSRLKKIFTENPDKFNQENYIELGAILNNYLMYKVAEGLNKSNELFDISLMILKNVYKKSGMHMEIDAYIQIFLNANLLEKYQWQLDYIEEFSKRLEDKYLNNAVHGLRAYAYFNLKRFDEALKEISLVKKFSHTYFKYILKQLYIKILYELNLYTEAEDAAKAFIQFLRNDKLIPKETKKWNEDFLKFFFKLLSAHQSKSKEKAGILANEIGKQKYLYSRTWLLEKASQVSGSYSLIANYGKRG